jgi:molybdate transport system substrate-binding protein
MMLTNPGRWPRLLLGTLIAAGWATAAPATGADAPLQKPGTVLVFAAASLRTALDEVGAGCRTSTGIELSASYAASSALARQIESGAPAEMFISADLDWMDYVDARRLIRTASRVDLLGNGLVLVAPAGSTSALTIGKGMDIAGALGGGRLAVADPASVPAGRYAKAALESLGVWTQVANRLAPAENVRAALLLVSRREAPLGIVYRTDAAADPGVRVVATFPPDTHPPIVYPAALTNRATADAATLLQCIQAPAARKVFERWGFTIRPGSSR